MVTGFYLVFLRLAFNALDVSAAKGDAASEWPPMPPSERDRERNKEKKEAETTKKEKRPMNETAAIGAGDRGATLRRRQGRRC